MSTVSVVMPSNKKFGLLFSGIFAIFCAYYYWKAQERTAIISGIAAFLFASFATVAPNTLEPLNKLWFRLGLLLGKIVSPIILTIVFFIVIVPVAVGMRILGRDALLMKRRLVSSYWIDREPSDPDAFKNQF